MPFTSGRFSAAVCFTMLHHVPTPALQDRLLADPVRFPERLRRAGFDEVSVEGGARMRFRAVRPAPG
jgi:hypothetical protein